LAADPSRQAIGPYRTIVARVQVARKQARLRPSTRHQEPAAPAGPQSGFWAASTPAPSLF